MITLEAGRIIAGKYGLERPLAKGGMGAVWVARHVLLDVVMAVKFMDPDTASSAEGRVRFEREAKAAAQLKSPHVVQVHDYGIEADTPYLVMELLDGEDLSTRLRRDRRLSMRDTSAILVQLAKGLRRAHDAGIVHRDLKPANIFLQRQDDDTIVKILDFGIAKSIVVNGPLSADATKTGTVIGSPQYMSPEQLRDTKGIDHRTDLWALGVILFRCLTGQLPFHSADQMSLIFAICMERIPLPSEVAPDLGPEVDRFFDRALARDREQRFQSVRALLDGFAALPGVALSGPGWADSGGSLASGPDGQHSLKSDSGALGRGSAPHAVALASSGNTPVSGAAPLPAAGRHAKKVLVALGAALLIASIALIVILRGPRTQGVTTAPSSLAAAVTLPKEGPLSSAGSIPSVFPNGEPAVGPVSPSVAGVAAVSALASGSVAPTVAPGRSGPSSPGRAPPPKASAKGEPQNSILGF